MIRGLQLYKGSWEYAVVFLLGKKEKRKRRIEKRKIVKNEKSERLPTRYLGGRYTTD